MQTGIFQAENYVRKPVTAEHLVNILVYVPAQENYSCHTDRDSNLIFKEFQWELCLI